MPRCWILKFLRAGKVPIESTKFSCHGKAVLSAGLFIIIMDLSVMLIFNGLPITARQYGEVVLPDVSTGHDPDTLARKLSRCKEGMAHFLPSWYKLC